jgi:hypothetical protein
MWILHYVSKMYTAAFVHGKQNRAPVISYNKAACAAKCPGARQSSRAKLQNQEFSKKEARENKKF